MFEFFYHNGAGHPNCLDNINASLGEDRPIIRPINLFMHTAIQPDGAISVQPPLSKAWDSVVLRAEMDVRLGVAACSVSESSCNSGKCSPIEITLSVQGTIRLAGFESGADCVLVLDLPPASLRPAAFAPASVAPGRGSGKRINPFPSRLALPTLLRSPRRFQFPGRSKGVFRMRAAFRARLDDEALLGVRRGGKRRHGRGPPRKTVLPLVH